MKTHYYKFAIRALIYKEDDHFVAHALDFDIPAYGDTEERAMNELQTLVGNQLSFAACKEKTEMIQFPAPQEFFDRWEKAHQALLKGEPVSERSLRVNGKAVVFVYADEDVQRLLSAKKRDFSRVTNLAGASA
jgi:hypothetical protein